MPRPTRFRFRFAFFGALKFDKFIVSSLNARAASLPQLAFILPATGSLTGFPLTAHQLSASWLIAS
jgi:hypothetical protein